MHTFRCVFLTGSYLTFAAALSAQTPSRVAVPADGSSWQRVKVLPVNTPLHVTTDHGGQSCRLLSVTDEALTCVKRNNAAGTVLSRSEVKGIKLTHHVRSALVGAAVGGGIGAISGGISGRSKPCPSGQGLCLNGIGIGAGAVAAIFGVGGAALGGVVGGLTDFARGSAIYTRP